MDTTPPPSGDGHLHAAFLALISQRSTTIVGQSALVERLLIALLADGHVLVERAPGLTRTGERSDTLGPYWFVVTGTPHTAGPALEPARLFERHDASRAAFAETSPGDVERAYADAPQNSSVRISRAPRSGRAMYPHDDVQVGAPGVAKPAMKGSPSRATSGRDLLHGRHAGEQYAETLQNRSVRREHTSQVGRCTAMMSG